eukprot:Pompholyxophrys_punicea_v1_NODE_1113_length_947_cov_7.669283.p1 type:complete len:184 gc:universal NODE_1113_length_947_cov_7.669283:125-676(+)
MILQTSQKNESPRVVQTVNGVTQSVVKTHNVNLMATFTVRSIPGETPINFNNDLNIAVIDFDSYISFLESNAVWLAFPYGEWKTISTGHIYNPWLDGQDDDALLFSLICHHYDESINFFKKDRKMDGVKLIDCFGPHPLKSQCNYADAYRSIATNFPEVGIHIRKHLFTMCCDYPGNMYTRKQ